MRRSWFPRAGVQESSLGAEGFPEVEEADAEDEAAACAAGVRGVGAELLVLPLGEGDGLGVVFTGKVRYRGFPEVEEADAEDEAAACAADVWVFGAELLVLSLRAGVDGDQVHGWVRHRGSGRCIGRGTVGVCVHGSPILANHWRLIGCPGSYTTRRGRAE